MNNIVHLHLFGRYKKNSERWAKLLKDEPMQGLEKAVWWTEYVLRHKDEDLSHLKGRANDIPLYQYFLLDVIAFFVGVVVAGIYLVYISVKLLMRIVRSVQSSIKPKLS